MTTEQHDYEPGSVEELRFHLDAIDAWVKDAASDLRMDEEVVWHDITVAYLTQEVDDLYLRGTLATGLGIPLDVVGIEVAPREPRRLLRTVGDALDVMLGGPGHYTSHHCAASHHRVCMAYYGGRSCECDCHAA